MGDTIAAISTSPGEGGIGIVRISGENASDIMLDIFAWNKGDLKKEDIIDRHMYYGHVVDNEKQVIDEVLVVCMKAPNTYTGEEIVEINCHGSMVALKKTLKLVLESGARLAEEGEFSKRAFLNGRMDLSQAEAVIDLIQAKTDVGYGVALDQLEGKFSNEIKSLKDAAMEILSEIIVNVDYPDADIEELTFEKLKANVESLREQVGALLKTFDVGRIIKDGFNVVIAGRPNVGKSSLLNSLLRENRAIVTEVPGTTRDAIEEVINIAGAPVRITDTAGIRETDDKVEALGIERSKNAFDNADLILLLLDGSEELREEDIAILENIGSRPVIVCVNKADLESKIDLCRIGEKKIFQMSMKTGEGLGALEKEIEGMIFSGDVKQGSSTMVTNVRHAELLRLAEEELSEVLAMIDRKEALDFIEMNIRRAIENLGSITGEVASEDILDEVFSRFCLGK